MLNNSILVTLMSMVGMAISFFNQLLMAKVFGGGLQMDAFLAGCSLPTMIAALISVALTYSLPPFLVSKIAENEANYPRTAGSLHLTLFVGGVVLFGFGAISPGTLLKIMSPGLPPQAFEIALPIARISWITGIAAITQVFFSCALNVSGRFLIPASAPLVSYGGMTLAILLFGHQIGPLATALGLLGGTYLAALMLAPAASRHIRLFACDWRAMAEIVPFLRKIPIFLIAMLCFTVYQTIDTFWAPRLGEGSLAALGYNQRILVAVGNLVIVGPSAVLMPRLSKAYLLEDKSEFFNLAQTVVRLVVALSCLIALAVIILRRPIVLVLFGRGAFDAHAQARVVTLLPYMMTGMVVMLTVVIIFRILFAKNNVLGPVIIGAACASSYFLISGLLSHAMGLTGIGIAYICSWSIGSIIAMRFVYQGRPPLLGNDLKGAGFLMKLTPSLILSGLIGELTYRCISGLIPIPSTSMSLVIMFVTTAAVIAPFLFATIKIFKVYELRLIYSLLLGKLALR